MSVNAINPQRQMAPLYIMEPLPSGRRRCTWKKLDYCDYTMIALTIIGVVASFVNLKGNEAMGSAIAVSIIGGVVILSKKLCEFMMPFSCRDYCVSQYFPERYGIPNYSIQENL